MELFDKLGDTIVSVSKDATQKAKDISELARIRMEIRAKQDYLNKLFLEIGKIYYDAHQDDEEKEFKEQMLLVKNAQEVLEELNQQLGPIKGMVKCSSCGQDMPMDADYCSKCGTKLVKPSKEETVEDDAQPNESSEEASAESETVQTNETVQEASAETVVVEEDAAVQTDEAVQEKEI